MAKPENKKVSSLDPTTNGKTFYTLDESGNSRKIDEADMLPDRLKVVDTLAELKSVSTTGFSGGERRDRSESTSGDGLQADYIFRTGDQSANVSVSIGDSWVVPDDRASDGSEGAWEQIHQELVRNKPGAPVFGRSTSDWLEHGIQIEECLGGSTEANRHERIDEFFEWVSGNGGGLITAPDDYEIVVGAPFRMYSGVRFVGSGVGATQLKRTGSVGVGNAANLALYIGSMDFQSFAGADGSGSLPLYTPNYRIVTGGIIGSRHVTCATPSEAGELSPGDIVWLWCPETQVNPNGSLKPNYQQINEVEEVNATTGKVTFTHCLDYTYTGAELRLSKASDTATSAGVDPYLCKDVELAHMTITASDAVGDTWTRYGGSLGAKIHDLHIEKSDGCIVTNGLAYGHVSRVTASVRQKALDIATYCHNSVFEDCDVDAEDGATFIDPGTTFGVIFSEGNRDNTIVRGRVNLGELTYNSADLSLGSDFVAFYSGTKNNRVVGTKFYGKGARSVVRSHKAFGSNVANFGCGVHDVYADVDETYYGFWNADGNGPSGRAPVEIKGGHYGIRTVGGKLMYANAGGMSVGGGVEIDAPRSEIDAATGVTDFALDDVFFKNVPTLSNTIVKADSYSNNIRLNDEQSGYYASGGDIKTTLDYATGTVSVTNGSASVTGSGTTWVSASVSSGNYIRFFGTGDIYEIDSVDSETGITLTQPFEGDTASGVSYQIFSSNPVKLSRTLQTSSLINGDALDFEFFVRAEGTAGAKTLRVSVNGITHLDMPILAGTTGLVNARGTIQIFQQSFVRTDSIKFDGVGTTTESVQSTIDLTTDPLIIDVYLYVADTADTVRADRLEIVSRTFLSPSRE